MRSLNVVIAIGLIVLTGALGYLLLDPQGSTFAIMPGKVVAKQPDPPSDSESASDSAKKDTKKSKPDSKHARLVAKKSDPPELPALINTPPKAEPAPAPVRQPPAPIPTAQDIQVGMEKTRLLTAFGRPTVRTTAVERDRLMEVFVYVNADHETATFATLRDGKVVAAQTTSY